MKRIALLSLLCLLAGCWRGNGGVPDGGGEEEPQADFVLPEGELSLIDPEVLAQEGKAFLYGLDTFIHNHHLNYLPDADSPELLEFVEAIEDETLEPCIAQRYCRMDAREVISPLGQLRVRKGFRMGLMPAMATGMGDCTRFFFYPDGRRTEANPFLGKGVSFRCEDYLRVLSGPEAAWQFYLLSNAIRVMPSWWHAGYLERLFIFRPDDMRRIRKTEFGGDVPLDFEAVLDRYGDSLHVLMPAVSRDSLGYVVHCTYWSPWEGLAREHVSVRFCGDRIVSFEPCDSTTVIYPYECMVEF